MLDDSEASLSSNTPYNRRSAQVGDGERLYAVILSFSCELLLQSNSRLHDQCFVIVRTGQGLKWPDPLAYFGAENEKKLNTKNSKGWPDQLHWPGMSPQAADWLVKNRDFVAFGMDAVSIDAGQVSDFKNSVHTVYF